MSGVRDPGPASRPQSPPGPGLLPGAGAVVAIWNGIEPGWHDEFHAWHDTEHIPERVAIGGFLRGRRYKAASGHPEYFTRYDLTSPDILTGTEYLGRLNAPTDWTRRVVPHFTHITRALCAVVAGSGAGARGWLATLRIFGTPAAPIPVLAQAATDLAGRHAGVTALLQTDAAKSAVPTAEKAARPPDLANPDWIFLAEARDRGAAEAMAADFAALLDPAQRIETGLYALESDLPATWPGRIPG